MVVVLNFDVQDEVAVFAFHLGDKISAAVFYALVFGFDDLGSVDLEVQQHPGNVDGDASEDVFGDDVFF